MFNNLIEDKKKGKEEEDKSPILFRISKSDFNSYKDYAEFMLFKKKLTESRQASDFYKRAVINAWAFSNGPDSDVFERLFSYISELGINKIIEKIENYDSRRSEEEILEKYTEKLIKKIAEKGVMLSSESTKEEAVTGHELSKADQDVMDDLC